MNVFGSPLSGDSKFIDNRDFKELFSMFDWDGGGSIDEEEFNAMLKVIFISMLPPPSPN